MRIVLQRVKRASVYVGGECVSSIGARPPASPTVARSDGLAEDAPPAAAREGGLLALVGLHENDTDADLEHCARRLVACKLWNNADETRPWRQSVRQRGYPVLLVSQFTLYATLSKKHQPDYKLAMKSDQARIAYEKFKDMVVSFYDGRANMVHDGVFGAMMDVELVNDGPVTIIIESNPSSEEKETKEEKKSDDKG